MKEDYKLLFNRFFMKLNLKNKINIDINRNNFSDNTINTIINKLFIEAYSNFLNNKSIIKNLKQKLNLSTIVLQSLRLNIFFEYQNEFEELLFFKLYKENKSKIISYKELKNLNETLILSYDEGYSNKILQLNSLFTILEVGDNLILVPKFLDILTKLSFGIKITKIEDSYCIQFDKNYENITFPEIQLVDTDNSFRSINIDLGKIINHNELRYYYGHFYNKNHPFLIEFIKHRDKIINENRNLFNEIVSILDSFNNYYFEAKVTDLNYLIKSELSKIIKINYRFTKKDFDI
ncbi:hypothetical protein [Chryseobacterium indoltheticum]|uniref:hypothetical protein n=1 Tax=Chryseobacterium indoltheticum TaxID=254 RepID=UPI003F496702